MTEQDPAQAGNRPPAGKMGPEKNSWGRIEATLRGLRKEGEKGLIVYITAGDPSLPLTVQMVAELSRAGADVIELGVPFSDPLADGPTIQKASQRSLAAGTTLAKILECVDATRRLTDVPLALMTYYNPLFRYGLECFLKEAAARGVDGLIVPDLPLEAGSELLEKAGEAGIEVVLFVAPTSTEERIGATACAASGFIYCLSVTGVTGARENLPGEAAAVVRRVRRYTDKPVAIGFGISGPGPARTLSRDADAVIVGSAIIDRVEANLGDPERLLAETAGFVRRLKEAVSR